MDWPLVAEVLKASLAPVVAAVAAYIAWLQWKTNALKVKLDLYERRLKVFEELKQLLSLVARETDVSLEELAKFAAGTAEAEFLFGPEVPTYLDQIYERSLQLWQANRERRETMRGNESPYDPVSGARNIRDHLSWLVEQLRKSRDVFRPYLSLNA